MILICIIVKTYIQCASKLGMINTHLHGSILHMRLENTRFVIVSLLLSHTK